MTRSLSRAVGSGPRRLTPRSERHCPPSPHSPLPPQVSSSLEALAFSLVSLSERVVSAEQSLSEVALSLPPLASLDPQTLLNSVQDLLVSPLSSNISLLAINVSETAQALDAKIVQTSHDMASRTLNSFRNLSASLSLNISTLREALVELEASQNETALRILSDLRAELQSSSHLLAGQAVENLTALNASLLEFSLIQRALLETKIDSHLVAMNASLSSLEATSAGNMSWTRESLASSINETAQLLEEAFLKNLSSTHSLLLSSLNQLNTSLRSDSLSSLNATSTRFEELHRQLVDEMSRARDDFSLSLLALNSSTGTLFLLLNSSVEDLNQTLLLSNQQIAGLATNTSQAIARSNAILTRVIADVNISLTEFKNASMTSFEEMFDSFSRSLQTAQTTLREGFGETVALLREEAGNETRRARADLQSLNSSVLADLSELMNSTDRSLARVNQTILTLQEHLAWEHLDLETRIQIANETLQRQLVEVSTAISSQVNATSLQLHQDLLQQASNMSRSLGALSSESGESLSQLRQALLSVGQLLYPSPTGANWTQPTSRAITDESWFGAFVDLSRRSPLVFTLLDERFALLDSEADTNFTRLRNESEARHTELRDLLSSGETALLASLNQSTDALGALIVALNHSLVLERESAALSAREREAFHANETQRLELLIQNSSLAHHQQISAQDVGVRSVLTTLQQNLSTTFLDLQTRTTLADEHALRLVSVLNQTLRSNSSALSAQIASVSNATADSLASLATLVQTNISSVLGTLSTEIASTRFLILNQTLSPLQLAIEESFLGTHERIDTLNSSSATALGLLANTTAGGLDSLSRNFSAEALRLSTVVSLLSSSTAEQVASLGTNFSSEIAAVNRSLLQLHLAEKALSAELSLFQQNQSAAWSEHLLNNSLLARSTTSLLETLNSTLLETNRSATEALLRSHALLSAEWIHSLMAVNESLRAEIAATRGGVVALVSALNESLSATHLSLSQALTGKLSQLERSVGQSQEELRVDFATRETHTRETFSLLLNQTQRGLDSALATTNHSLRSELSSISSRVDQSLLLSLQNTSRLLSDHTLLQDGKVALMAHQIARLDNSTTTLLASSSSLAIDGALLEERVGQLAISMADSKRDQLLTTTSLREMEVALVNATALLSSSQSSLSHLWSDHTSLRHQFTFLLSNTSLNAQLLGHISLLVNASQQATQLSLLEAKDQTSQLRAQFEREQRTVERLGSELRNLTEVTVQKAFAQLDETKAEQARAKERLEESAKRGDAKIADLGTATESLGRRVTGLEQELRGVKELDLGAVKKTIEDGRARCDLMTGTTPPCAVLTQLGDLRKEFERSQGEKESSERRMREMGEKLASLETRAAYQDKRIAELVEENEKMRKSMAPQVRSTALESLTAAEFG
jgi:hypothetical protein